MCLVPKTAGAVVEIVVAAVASTPVATALAIEQVVSDVTFVVDAFAAASKVADREGSSYVRAVVTVVTWLVVAVVVLAAVAQMAVAELAVVLVV